MFTLHSHEPQRRKKINSDKISFEYIQLLSLIDSILLFLLYSNSANLDIWQLTYWLLWTTSDQISELVRFLFLIQILIIICLYETKFIWLIAAEDSIHGWLSQLPWGLWRGNMWLWGSTAMHLFRAQGMKQIREMSLIPTLPSENISERHDDSHCFLSIKISTTSHGAKVNSSFEHTSWKGHSKSKL